MPMDLKNQRRSTHVEDDRLHPFWQDYNNSVLADLFGPHKPPFRGGRIYPVGELQEPSSKLASEAGIQDIDPQNWIDDEAELLMNK